MLNFFLSLQFPFYIMTTAFDHYIQFAIRNRRNWVYKDMECKYDPDLGVSQLFVDGDIIARRECDGCVRMWSVYGDNSRRMRNRLNAFLRGADIDSEILYDVYTSSWKLWVSDTLTVGFYDGVCLGPDPR